MTEQHPITPPPELVQQWREKWQKEIKNKTPYIQLGDYIATQAARWGDEQRLEACIAWLHYNYPSVNCAAFRAAMRPKPPSLAEQALEALGPVPLPETGGTDDCFLNAGAINRYHTIRAALERLQELEKGNE